MLKSSPIFKRNGGKKKGTFEKKLKLSILDV